MQIEKKIGKSFLKIAGADAKMHFFYFNFFIDLIYCVVFSGMPYVKTRQVKTIFFIKITYLRYFLCFYFLILLS